MELLEHAPQFGEVPWPVTRGELVRFAAAAWVPLQVLEELFELPDDETSYVDLTTVSEAIRAAQTRRVNESADEPQA